MSLMGMRRKMASKKTHTIILWILVAVFLVGVLLWSVPGRNLGKAADQPRYNGPDAKLVAVTVNGTPITVGQINDAYYALQDQARQQSTPQTFDTITQQRSQALTGLVMRELADQALAKFHARVTDGYLRKLAHDYGVVQLADLHKQAAQNAESQLQQAKTPAAKKKVQTADQIFTSQLASAMQQMDPTNTAAPTESSFLNYFVNEYLMNKMHDQFADNGRLQLLGAEIAKQLPVDPLSEDFIQKMSTQEVNGRYIFVAAKEATPQAVDEAKKKADELHAQVEKNPTSFAPLAKANSDDRSASQSGSLGWVNADQMMFFPAMTQYLLYSQQPGELGPVVQISNANGMTGQPQVGYGFVIVDGTRQRSDLKDFNWQRDKDVAMLRAAQQFETNLGAGYQVYCRDIATIKFNRHELKAYWLEANNQYNDAMKEYQKALTDDPNMMDDVRAAISYKVSLTTPDIKQKIDLISTALPYAGDQTASLHLSLARLYEEQKQNDKAIEQLDNAASIAEVTNDVQLHKDLRTEYQRLNDTKGAAEMDKWLKDHPQSSPSTPGMTFGGGAPMTPPPSQ